MFRQDRSIVAALALGLAVAALAADPPEEVLSLRDGRAFQGVVSRVGKAIRVRQQAKDIYVSPKMVRDRQPAPASEANLVYHFNRKLVDRRKRGRVFLVVRDQVWERIDSTGVAKLSLTDPKLGRVEMRMAITKAAPTRVMVEGVEYEYRLVFPLEHYRQAVVPMVLAQIARDDLEQLLKGARFFKQASLFEPAEKLLAEAGALAPNDAGVAAEVRSLATWRFRAAAAEVERLAQLGQIEAAHALASELTAPPALQETPPKEVAAFEEVAATVQRQMDLLQRIGKFLQGRGVEAPDLSYTQAKRLYDVIKLAKAAELELPDDSLPSLTAAWVDSLPRTRLTAEQLEEALRLARLAAAFFAQEAPDSPSALLVGLRSKTLPLKLKLEILRHAGAYPTLATETWQQVDYVHPFTKKRFVYYYQLPPNYTPGRSFAAMLTLHGMGTDASVMNRFWGPAAKRHGFILISPEYVYGRDSGYFFSEEEHHAVLGAVQHAARTINIDMNRVFLQGNSQGAHAAWDIGAGAAGRFAGIIPIIGMTMMKGHGLENFLDSAMYIVDGSEDGGIEKRNREAMDALAKLGGNATYVEYRGRGHEAFYEEYDDIAAWMAQRRRRRDPKSLHLVALRYANTRRQWIKIVDADDRLPTRTTNDRTYASVSAVIKGNTLRARARKASRLRFYFNPSLVDMSKPVTIYVNGRPKFKGPLEIDWVMALEDAFLRRDRQSLYLSRVTVEVR